MKKKKKKKKKTTKTTRNRSQKGIGVGKRRCQRWGAPPPMTSSTAKIRWKTPEPPKNH
jgi:hypothetical protein